MVAIMSGFVSRVKKWRNNLPSPNSYPTSHLETWAERKKRRAALMIIHIKTLVYFSVVAMVMPPTWPYLQSIDPNADKTLVGWIIIGVPALRPINALLVGWILRHFSIRLVTIVSGIFVMVSCVMWSTAYHAPVYGGYWLLFSRFVIGFFGAEFQIGTTHIGAATTQQERSTAMTILAGCLSMAYMMAPGLMSAISYVGSEGVMLGNYRLNMYTVAGWLGFVAYGIALLMFLVYYEENDIAVREASLSNQVESKETAVDGTVGDSDEQLILDKTSSERDSSGSAWRTDYLAVAACNIMAAHCYGWLQLPDTMMTVMLMDLFAWDEQTAVRRAGNLLTIFGVFALIGFVTTGRLAKRYPERVLMLTGNAIYLLGSILMFPVDDSRAVYFYTNSTTVEMEQIERKMVMSRGGHSYITTLMHANSVHMMSRAANSPTTTVSSPMGVGNTTTDASILSTPVSNQQLGCPAETQPWCVTEPRPHLLQLALSFCLSMVATPFVLPMVNSAVSKLLPPGNQSFMWGVVNGSANLGRLLYPLLNVYVYTYYGPRLQYMIMIVLSAVVLLLQLLVYKRLLPASARDNQKIPLKESVPVVATSDYGSTQSAKQQ